MRWEDREESSNVEDRRGSSSGGGGGRGMPSMSTIMFLLPFIKTLLKTKFGWAIIGVGAVVYFSGFNPLSSVTGGGGANSSINEKADNNRQGLYPRFYVTLNWYGVIYLSLMVQPIGFLKWYFIVVQPKVVVVMPLHRWDLFTVLLMKKSI